MRLYHVNPALNEKTLWYVVVGESDQYYFCVVHGPTGNVSSTMHAVWKGDYVKEGEHHAKPDDAEEFL